MAQEVEPVVEEDDMQPERQGNHYMLEYRVHTTQMSHSKSTS